jgi:predicted MFS family arabinose efflux permease
LGWATTTPQQHRLFQLNKEEGKVLSSLNSSAMGLGAALGTIMGGSLIANGIEAVNLPFYASALLLVVLLFQLLSVPKLKWSIINE